MKNLLLMIQVLFLSGCAGIGISSEKTTITETTNPTTLEKVTTTTTEPTTAGGFFESANLKNYFAFETERNAAHERAVSHKIDAINENAIRVIPDLQTPTERALFGIVISQQIAAIPVETQPDGIRSPKTIIDYGISLGDWGARILVGGLGTAFGADVDWLTGGTGSSSDGDSTSLKGVTVAGDLNINSTFKNKYNL